VLREAYLRHAREGSDAPELEGALAHILGAAGGAAGPPEVFLRHLARAVPDARELPNVATTFHAADFGLVVAALEGSAVARTRIVKENLSQVPAWVARIDTSRAFADDVTQELSALLFVPQEGRASKLLGYSGRGPLGGFLRTVAVRTAQNMRRGKQEIPVDEPPAPVEETRRGTPEGALARADHAQSFAALLRSAILSLPEDDRELLRLHYLEGLSIEGVAAARKVSRATAARHLARARDAVLARAEAVHAAEAGPVTRSAGGGIDIPSELALSLSKLFRGE
jgi:RNA polymerase sigma-70 factor (ECF subfamily)